MVESIVSRQRNDDPRKLSALINRASDLAREHAVGSVVVGLAADEGDLLFPEYVDYLASALRVEDGIFRMTRERAVLHLVDLDAARACAVLERLTADFCEEFPAQSRPQLELRMFEAKPGTTQLSVKDVLTQIFAERVLH